MIRVVGDSRSIRSTLGSAGLDHLTGQVPCVVGSPPYNVAIPNYPSGYRDHRPWRSYAVDARLWAATINHLLCPGGRAWVVVQQTAPEVPGEPGGPRINLAHIWMDALAWAGLNYRDTICWVQDSFDGACAWGSWLQPSAPNLRGSSELILLYHKGLWKRPAPPEWKGKRLPKGELGGTWEDLVRNVWKINPANTRANATNGPKGLPAAYPIDLPARAIRLSTWPGEWVVDPWAGHCTTGFAADALGRQSVMIDLGFDEDFFTIPAASL